MKHHHLRWTSCFLLPLLFLPLLLPGRSLGSPPVRRPDVLPPNLALVEQWRQEGRPLPPFVTDPQSFYGPAEDSPQRVTAPLTGTLNALAVLVDFSDNVSTTTATFFDHLIFDPPVAGRGSVRDYWQEVSYGQVDVVTVDLPSSIGWVRAPSGYGYYTNGEYCIGSYPQNCQLLAEEVVDAVSAVVDFSKYDNDGDGYTEPIILIHAGPEGYLTGDPDDIWGHSWSLHSPRSYDGVTISDYVITSEYWQTAGPDWSDMTIGPICHEMGHGFWGMADMYDYDGSSVGLGRWTLMANGWTNGPDAGAWGVDASSPAWPDAWNRILAGFETSQAIRAPAAPFTFPPVETTPGSIFRFNSSALHPQEYFLLENRQRIAGDYDEYMPGGGLFIWHIDDSLPHYGANDNECRSTPHCSGSCASSHYLVALEQADGQDDLEWRRDLGDAADPFPGSGGRTFWQPYFQNPGVNPESGSWFDSGCADDSCIDLRAISCTAGSSCTAVVYRATCGGDADLGDAPAGQNHQSLPMTAYAPAGPLPSVPASFPTTFLAGAPGPRHHLAGVDCWLGAAASREFDADLSPDEDGATNITPTLDLADQDSGDDGVQQPFTLDACGSTALAYTVTVAPAAGAKPRYLNAWFDWNHDGDWADVLTCTAGMTTAEWGVRDQALDLPAGVYHGSTPAFQPWVRITSGAPWEAWMRVTLAEAAAPPPYDGRGPALGYEYGETEDYILSLFPTLAISTGLGTAPVPGERITYTIRLGGQGNVAAAGTRLVDVLSPVVEYRGADPPGDYDPLTHRITWTTTLDPRQPTTLTLAVEVIGAGGDVITNPVVLHWAGAPWITVTASLTVDCPPGDPTAAFSWTVPACLSTTVQFTSLSSGTLPLSLSWDLDGDGQADSTAAQPAWAYGGPGAYTVTLTATNGCGQDIASAVVTVGEPLNAVEIGGPAALWTGQRGHYTATATPVPPAGYEWSNGTAGVTATYSWDDPGWHTVAVTASNDCSQVTATLSVAVSLCVPLDGVAIAGPGQLEVGEAGTFLATPHPPTATTPAYLWSNGTVGSSAVYSWTVPGDYTVTVTVTNCLEALVRASVVVQVRPVYRVYLPLVLRGSP